MKRTLVLERESLTELTAAELSGVAAGAWEMTPSCPLFIKLSELLTCYGA